MRNSPTLLCELQSQCKVQLRVKILLQVFENMYLFGMFHPEIPINCVISLADFISLFIRNDKSFIKNQEILY